MTDEQWADLTYWLKLPATARVPIENELDLFARVAAAAGPVPAETRKKLERAAGLAVDLLRAIEEFGPEEHEALSASRPATVDLAHDASAKLARLVGHPRATPRFDARKLLVEQHAHLTAFRDRMAAAARSVAKGKSGSDASNVRALVRRVSEVIEARTGKTLGKGKPASDFTRKLCALADPTIKEGTIKGAIESLTSEKLASENSANSG